MKLRIADAAEADLAEIWATIATEASEQVATGFLAKIDAMFAPLLLFPLSGPARSELAPDLRVTFCHPYAIYYIPTADALIIVRIIHGARDVMALAERGWFV